MDTRKTIKLNDEGQAICEQIMARYRLGQNYQGAVMAALRDWREEHEMDRIAQVNWLVELAANIAQNLGEGTAEDLVKYAESAEGTESWGIEWPGWFDDHDRRLLVREVAKNLP